MSSRRNRIGRTVIVLVGLAVGVALGWAAFVVLPTTLADVLGVALAIGVAVLGARAASRLADGVFPSYNVAEVAVEGPITRDGRGVLPRAPGGTPADDIVEQIEAADADGNARGLVLKLNTPGGEVGASDDIRRAARAFDGPTIAYATDLCASGGYWIATGCDSVWARDHTLVGSIGVIMSRVTAAELADKLGLTYERIAAGKYKDAGIPLKEMTDDERAYLQGLTDGFYEDFVERVAGSTDLAAEDVRETEARVFLGGEAHERGLVDRLGHRDALEEHLGSVLEAPVSIRAFEPERSLRDRLRGATIDIAYAAGAGAASSVSADREPTLELR